MAENVLARDQGQTGVRTSDTRHEKLLALKVRSHYETVSGTGINLEETPAERKQNE